MDVGAVLMQLKPLHMQQVHDWQCSLKARQDEAEAERAKNRKEQVGSGERSDKIRTYNYKDNRVSDHRINLTLKKLDQVLDGDLSDFIDALIADNETTRLATLEE